MIQWQSDHRRIVVGQTTTYRAISGLDALDLTEQPKDKMSRTADAAPDVAAESLATTPAGTISRGALLVLFTTTIFLGAVLVFGVQPIAARLLLPRFGGSPSVWSAASLFFQLALLAGYAYSFVLTRRVEPRYQPLIHLPVLAIPLLLLPLSLPLTSQPGTITAPAIAVLTVLAIGVGIPFAVASTTGPLLQRWFSLTGHRSGSDPYFLYAASNTGSLLVLLAYPFLLEPSLTLGEQSIAWSFGYAAFALLAAMCAVVIFRQSPSASASIDPNSQEKRLASPTWGTRARWITLAAVPSALSLGATQHITTDIAAIPLLWIGPLALYLLSFVIAFSRRNPLSSHVAGRLLPLPVVAAVVTPFVGGPIWLAIGSHLLLLFLAAVMCHARLAEERPPAQYLTEFYLLLSIGGALGGVFVSLLAPQLFDRIWEYPAAIVAALLLRPRAHIGSARVGLLAAAAVLTVLILAVILVAWAPDVVPAWAPWVALAGSLLVLSRWRPVMALATALLLGVTLIGAGDAIYTERTFFGVYRVAAVDGRHELFHGTTLHGMQIMDAARRKQPHTYYDPTGPIGQVFTVRGDQFERISVVGLGVGTLASYGVPGQHFTFYEIDPGVVDLAQDPRLFTYVSDSKAEIKIQIADGRLGLAADPTLYDLVVVDAFSSDAIPVHLFTREAVSVYADHLAPGGIIAFHITNRYLDLEPVLGSIVDSLDMSAVIQDQAITEAEATAGKAASTWVLIAKQADNLAPFNTDPRWAEARTDPGGRVWTDAYSDLIGALR